jgi:DNA-binding transcriptional ArsR family regulator
MNSRHNLKYLEDITEVLRAIAHPMRLVIIEMLHEQGELTVTQIHEQLDVEQAIASHHLRILKDKDVVDVRRVGKNSFYALTNPSFFQVFAMLRR